MNTELERWRRRLTSLTLPGYPALTPETLDAYFLGLEHGLEQGRVVDPYTHTHRSNGETHYHDFMSKYPRPPEGARDWWAEATEPLPDCQLCGAPFTDPEPPDKIMTVWVGVADWELGVCTNCFYTAYPGNLDPA